MAIYTDVKCPYCNHTIYTAGNIEWESKIGITSIRCPACGRIAKTDKKEWVDFNQGEKVSHMLDKSGLVLVAGILGFFMVPLICKRQSEHALLKQPT